MTSRFLLAFGLLALAGAAHAQTARDLTEISMDLHQAAMSTARMERLNREMFDQPVTWLEYDARPGTLITTTGKRLPVKALRYNVALHVVEARDSTGKRLWGPDGLRGFEFGNGPGRRQFQSLPVRNRDVNQDFVEVLTVDADGQLILGAEHAFVHEDEQLHPVLKTVLKPAVNQVVYDVVSAPVTQPQTPLRPLTLGRKQVLKVFGNRERELEIYALKNNLNYEALADVLKMANYYNELTKRPVKQ